MKAPADPIPGIYGKLPSNGDFVTRRLPATFWEPWDQWLQRAISDSRDQLGDHWLGIYLTSPIWRFALSPGVIGQLAWAGLLMPSVDRVGRYFPLSLACPLPAASNPIDTMAKSESWYDSAENLLRSCLENELELGAFDRQVSALGAPTVSPPLGSLYGGPWNARRMPLSEDLSKACAGLLHQTLGELFFAFSLWWSRGSDLVEPSLLVCQGLPPTKGFTAMLAGEWDHLNWGQATAPRGKACPPEGNMA